MRMVCGVVWCGVVCVQYFNNPFCCAENMTISYTSLRVRSEVDLKNIKIEMSMQMDCAIIRSLL